MDPTGHSMERLDLNLVHLRTELSHYKALIRHSQRQLTQGDGGVKISALVEMTKNTAKAATISPEKPLF